MFSILIISFISHLYSIYIIYIWGFLDYEYNTKKDTISANNPVASAKANPKIAYVNNCPRIAGFRAVEAINDENTDPIPIPAPVNPIAANPAPIYFAACNILKKNNNN
jgi:hypothetical protein